MPRLMMAAAVGHVFAMLNPGLTSIPAFVAALITPPYESAEPVAGARYLLKLSTKPPCPWTSNTIAVTRIPIMLNNQHTLTTRMVIFHPVARNRHTTMMSTEPRPNFHHLSVDSVEPQSCSVEDPDTRPSALKPGPSATCVNVSATYAIDTKTPAHHMKDEMIPT